MAKGFALVNGLSKIFNTYTNEIGETKYDTSTIKEGVFAAYNVDRNTLYYIKTDATDNTLGYIGTFVYTHGELFSNYKGRYGQFICQGIKNENENDYTAFLIANIVPRDQYSPWFLSYNIKSYSSNSALNSEFDIFIYGIGTKLTNYYSFNSNGEKAPYCYHVIKPGNSSVSIGVCLYDTFENNITSRNISFNISNLTNCEIKSIPLTGDTLDNCYLIDAKHQGFEEVYNNNQLKIQNIKINQIEGNTLKNHPRQLYAFDTEGNIAPLVSVNTEIPYAGADNNRQYNTLGFDYTKGIYYSCNDNGSLAYVKGNIFSAYSGVDLRYVDNVTSNLIISKPVYIRGQIGQDGLFYISPILTEQYKRAWTQDVSDGNYVYWFVGYPQDTDETYIINLFEKNDIYEYNQDKLQPINPYSKSITITPTGTISTPIFYGTTQTISVSGQVSGTNSSSLVNIVGQTTSVTDVVDRGELATINLNTDTEIATFIQGKLPEIDSKEVWIGVEDAVAEAQQFNGDTVTFTGTYTPSGTISTPIFYGDNITFRT